MIDPYPIRLSTEDEFDAAVRVNEHALIKTPLTEEHRTRSRALLEYDRTLSAWDGSEIVGTATAHSFQLSVPGAVVPAAGVTWVAVLPTHRRRGILRSLMRHQPI